MSKLGYHLVCSHTKMIAGTDDLAVDLSLCQVAALYDGVAFDLCTGPARSGLGGSSVVVGAGAGKTPVEDARRRRDAAGMLDKLVALDLSINSIERVQNLTPLRRLKELNLSVNHVVSCAGIEQLQQLTSLNLSNNSITTLEGLGALPHLEELDVSINQLVSVVGLQHCTRLRRLDVSANNIASLLGIESAGSLRQLSTQRNALQSIDPVAGLALTELNASGNGLAQLRQVAEVIQAMPALVKLDLVDNPITRERLYRVAMCRCATLQHFDGVPVYNVLAGAGELEIEAEDVADTARVAMADRMLKEKLILDTRLRELHDKEIRLIDAYGEFSQKELEGVDQQLELLLDDRGHRRPPARPAELPSQHVYDAPGHPAASIVVPKLSVTEPEPASAGAGAGDFTAAAAGDFTQATTSNDCAQATTAAPVTAAPAAPAPHPKPLSAEPQRPTPQSPVPLLAAATEKTFMVGSQNLAAAPTAAARPPAPTPGPLPADTSPAKAVLVGLVQHAMAQVSRAIRPQKPGAPTFLHIK